MTGDEDRSTGGLRRRPLSAALKATRDVSVELADLPQIRKLIELVGRDRLPSVAVEPLQAVGA